MNSESAQKLKLGGQDIQQLAQARLAQLDVKESVMQAIESGRVNARKTASHSYWYGLAAAIGLTVMIWAINSTDSIQSDQPNHNQQVVTKPIDLNFKELPLSLEQRINQPLIDEQQAIIADLKALQAQLLSI